MGVHPPGARFVGRTAELAKLAETGRLAARGEPQVVIVSGEAGVGKTRLVEQFAAGSGARMVTGACVDLGSQGLPLAPVISALRQLVRDVGMDRLIALSSGMAMLTCLDGSGEHDKTHDQVRLAYVVGDVLTRLSAEFPLLLVIEDLHWSDQATLDLLGGLVRELRDARVHIVLTFRTDELPSGHPVRAFLADLGRLSRVSRIDLDRCTRSETAELIAGVLGAEPQAALVTRIFERSGGNAFFIEELLHREQNGMSADIGDTLREVLLRRVGKLDDPTVRVVHAAAVGGSWVSHHLLAAVLPEEDLSAAVREAVDQQILIVSGPGYGFRHELVREAVIGSLLPGARIPLHRKYAEVLTENPGLISAERHAATVAHHWWCADVPEQALPAHLHAASAAESMHAHAERLHLLRRAHELWPRVPGFAGPAHVDLLEQLADAARHTGAIDEALRYLDLAIDQVTDQDRASRLLAQRGRLLLHQGRAEALATVERAERLVAREASAARGEVLEILSLILVLHGHADRAIQACDEAIRIADELGDHRLAVVVRTTRALAIALTGDHGQALDQLRAARRLAESHAIREEILAIQVNLAFLEWSVGNLDNAIRQALDGLALIEQFGLSRAYGTHLTAFLAIALFDAGRWDEAHTRVAETLDLAPQGIHAGWLHLVAADITIGRGDFDAARQHVSTAQSILGGRENMAQSAVHLAYLTARIALYDNRIADARQAITAVLDLTANATSTMWTLLCTAARIEARSPSGETELLRKVADGLAVSTPVWQAHSAQFHAELGSAESLGWPAVVAAWDAAGQPYPACYARFRSAEAAVLAKDRAAAIRWLTDATAQAERLGARPLLREINDLARRAHLRTGDDAGPAQLGLTRRELEVLRLLTKGWPNRRIAAELVIADKTVSVHVSRILTKLAVSTRGEAAAAARRLGLLRDSDFTDP